MVVERKEKEERGEFKNNAMAALYEVTKELWPQRHGQSTGNRRADPFLANLKLLVSVQSRCLAGQWGA